MKRIINWLLESDETLESVKACVFTGILAVLFIVFVIVCNYI